MKKLRQLARRSGLFASGKQGKRRRPSTAARVLGSETLEKRQLLAGDVIAASDFAPQHNYLAAHDVNNDGQITALDALIIVNELGRSGGEGEAVAAAAQETGFFYDVNADQSVTALDALSVINAVARSETVEPLIELQLRALADPDDIDSEITGPINVGETFHLEISFDDLRQNSLGNIQEVGAFQLIADIGVSEGGVLVPVLHEVQNLFIQGFENDNGTTGIESFDSVEFSATIDGVVVTESSTAADFNSNAVGEIARVLGVFGFDDDQFSVSALPTINNQFGFQIIFEGDELANQDVPNLSFDLIETDPNDDIETAVDDISPFLDDGTTPNPDAVPFAIDTNSRTFGNNDEFIQSLIDGSFTLEDGFTQIRGVGPLVAGGVPAANDGEFEQPFDVFSVPVQLSRPVENLVLTVSPSDIDESVLLFVGESAPDDSSANVPNSQVQLDADAVVTLSTVEAVAPGTFSIDPESITVNEDDGGVTFTVNRTGGSDGSVTVEFDTVNGTALATTDFVATNQTLTFGDGVTSQQVTVPLVNDEEEEGTETFTALLSGATGGATIDADSNSSIVTINDDDLVVVNPGQFAISPPTISVPEEGSSTAEFTVTRSDGSDGVVTVDFSTVNGTATAGDDFVANSGTLTFLDGQTTATITVVVNDDDIVEADETFAVQLSNASGGATLGAAFSSTVTIVDNDVAPVPGVLSIAPESVTVNEDVGLVSFTVNRTDGDDGEVSVDFTTNNGTAVAGEDFTANSGTLTFADGVTSQTVTVEIEDDDLEEITETFTVSLSSPTGGATLGTVTTSTVSIAASDAPVPGTLSITPAALSVNEDDTTATLTINRTGGTDGEVSVIVATTNGTATAGSDFVAVNEVVTFADGETSQTIDITISEDTLDEPNESFTVTISNPTGGADLGTTTSTITILDDDEPIVNNPPTSGPVTVAATEDIAATFAADVILANASPGEDEDDSQTVSISSVPTTSSQGGTVNLNSDGGISYQPAQDFNGTDSFVVTITDDASPALTATFTVTVNVAAVNDDPVAGDDTATTLINQPVTIDVLDNDNAGPDNEDQTLTVTGTSAQGSVLVNTDNTLTFTPLADFTGTATISYTITDSDGAQDSATVTVTVQDFVPVTISGSVFIDNVAAAGNVPGVQDEGFDQGIGSIEVQLISSTGVTVGTAVTNLDGSFEFTNVAPGDYTVVYDVPSTLRINGATSFSLSVDPNVSTSPTAPVLSVAGTQNTGLEVINLLSSSYLRSNPDIADLSSGGSQGGSVTFDANGDQELFIAGAGFDGVNFAEVLESNTNDSAILVIAREGASEVEVATIGSDQIVRSANGSSLRFFGGLEDLNFAPEGEDEFSVDLARFEAAVDRAMQEL